MIDMPCLQVGPGLKTWHVSSTSVFKSFFLAYYDSERWIVRNRHAMSHPVLQFPCSSTLTDPVGVPLGRHLRRSGWWMRPVSIPVFFRFLTASGWCGRKHGMSLINHAFSFFKKLWGEHELRFYIETCHVWKGVMACMNEKDEWREWMEESPLNRSKYIIRCFEWIQEQGGLSTPHRKCTGVSLEMTTVSGRISAAFQYPNYEKSCLTPHNK